jgi:hypothetical protein
VTAYALVLDADSTEFHWIPVAVVASAQSGLTFSLCPEYELPVTYRRRGIRTPASAGFVQRRTIWGEGDLRTFTLGWRTMNSAEVALLRDLWARTRGPVKAMNYTTFAGESTLVHFKRPYLRFSPRAPDAWAVQLELEEVR